MTLRLLQGTAVWFEMVGREIVRAAMQVGLPPDLRMSVVEKYVDGDKIDVELLQGLRIDVVDGSVVTRVGVRREERADVVIEVAPAVARHLNLLRSTDPAYAEALHTAVSNGDLRIGGDLGPLRPVFERAHDRIVGRSC